MKFNRWKIKKKNSQSRPESGVKSNTCCMKRALILPSPHDHRKGLLMAVLLRQAGDVGLRRRQRRNGRFSGVETAGMAVMGVVG